MLTRRNTVKLGLSTLTSFSVFKLTHAQVGTPQLTDTELGNMLQLNVPSLPQAKEGEVEVVLSGQGDGSYVGVVIHNASNEVVGLDDVSGIARDASGSLYAVSENSILAPYELQPGEYGLGLVPFDKDITADIDITFEVKTETPGAGFMELVDIPVTEVSIDGDKVIGLVENTTNVEASSLVAVVGVFFAEDGTICGWFRTYLNDSVSPGGIGTFSSSGVDGVVSASYAISASGWAG